MIAIQQFKVESESRAGKFYVVSEFPVNPFAVANHLAHAWDAVAKMPKGMTFWQCSCIGWTRHVPRKDCKHIEWVKRFGGIPLDPMLHAMDKAQRTFKECPGFVGSDDPEHVVVEPALAMEAFQWLKRRFHVNEKVELSTDSGLCIEVRPRVRRSPSGQRRARVSFAPAEQFKLAL
jgi:hypothetical protein